MPRYHLNTSRLYAAVDERRTALRLSWREVGDVCDLPGSFFTRLSYGKGMNADAFLSLLAFLGTQPRVLAEFSEVNDA